MRAKDLRIVFMGTPDLASHVLQSIADHNYNVVAVVTAPDRPAGRGRNLQQAPVKQYAARKKIPVLQPESLKAPEFVSELLTYKADLQVVVAFRKLPEAVWSMPGMGCFNLHASLLPDYRGAAPVNWVIINGEKETGVTTFLIDHQIDTGQILLQRRIPVGKYETAGSLHEKIKTAGAPLVIDTIEALAKGTVKPVQQDQLYDDDKILNKAPKIYKEDCRIHWERPCMEVVNLIHGLSPQPGAFCEIVFNEEDVSSLRIYIARPQITPHDLVPGTMLTDRKTFLHVATPDGFVEVLELQMAGKKRLETQAFLRGLRFNSLRGTIY